jgi:hypothetical protein
MPTTRIWSGASTTAFATAGNWDSGVPVSGDSAVFPALAAGKDVVGSDQSAILLANLTVEPGCFSNFGSRLAYLKLDVDDLIYEGSGYAFLNLVNTTSVLVEAVGSAPATGSYGLDLIGGTNAYLRLEPGNGKSVGVAAGATQTATFTTLEALTGNITLGSGLTSTTISSQATNLYAYCSPTTYNQNGGAGYWLGGIPATINVNSGTLYIQSATTMPAVAMNGGVLDLTRDARAKTITSLTGTGGTIRLFPGQLTVTTPTFNGVTFDYVR